MGLFLTEVLASVLTSWGIYLLSQKKPFGNLVSLVAQIPWWVVILGKGLYGFLPLEIALTGIYIYGTYRENIQPR